MKPGGLLLFTHKTAVWPSWEPLQARLVDDGFLNEVAIEAELDYLPGDSDLQFIDNRKLRTTLKPRPSHCRL